MRFGVLYDGPAKGPLGLDRSAAVSPNLHLGGEARVVRRLTELRHGMTEVLDNNPPASNPRGWRRDDLAANEASIFHALDAEVLAEISAAVGYVRAGGLDAETMEQEDFRVPALARQISGLRERLDDGNGIVILRGLKQATRNDTDAEIVAWGVANYFGQPIRQGLKKDRRLFSVTDTGGQYNDPTRIGATSGTSWMHTDNGCLEPRPPCYLGLLCVQRAKEGGVSTLISANTLRAVIEEERPDLLPLYFEPYHFRPPTLHTWPAGPPTIVKPILEEVQGEILVHYARVMIEPGMEAAGTPLTPRQLAALDYFDGLLERPDLRYEYQLQPGEFMITNNRFTLHGRTAYVDGTAPAERRLLKRIWLWRRHVGPGTDPVALDLAELA